MLTNPEVDITVRGAPVSVISGPGTRTDSKIYPGARSCTRAGAALADRPNCENQLLDLSYEIPGSIDLLCAEFHLSAASRTWNKRITGSLGIVSDCHDTSYRSFQCSDTSTSFQCSETGSSSQVPGVMVWRSDN